MLAGALGEAAVGVAWPGMGWLAGLCVAAGRGPALDLVIWLACARLRGALSWSVCGSLARGHACPRVAMLALGGLCCVVWEIGVWGWVGHA